MKNRFSYLLRILISFALLGLLFWFFRRDLNGILETLKITNLTIFASAVVLYILTVIFTSYRLKKLLKVQDISLSLKDVSCLNFIGFFFNNFMPTAVGGDIVKAYYASKRSRKKVGSITSVLADRLFGLYSLIFIAFLALVFNFPQIKNNLVIYAILLLTTLVIIFLLVLLNSNVTKLFNPLVRIFRFFKIREKVKKLYDAMILYKHNKKVAWQAFLISFMSQLVSILVIWIIARSLSLNITYFTLMLTIPIVATLSMLPSLNGLGIREGAFVYFLKDFIGADKAFAMSLLWLAMIMVISIIGGLIYMFNRQFRSIKVAVEVK